VLAVISGAVAVHSALGYEMVEAGTFGSLVALYGAASLTDSRRGLFAAAIAAAALAVFFATNRGQWSLAQMAATTATWAVAWFAGTFVRQRSEQAQHADARAGTLERERDARAREAVADERARMARELHDIVGHALNVVVIQAAGARRVFDVRPEVARDALASIESTGREALFEMELMLGVLHDPDTDAGGSGPQPGLGQLDALAAHVSEAGLPVEIIIEGDRQDLPASVELSAYRLCRNRSRTASSTRAPLTLR
jgi:signal transduction histidine kinase